MVETAQRIGANTFAFFTRNPRGSKAKPEDPSDCAKAVELLKEYEFGPLGAHGAYTMNLCTADPEPGTLPVMCSVMICAVWQRFPVTSIISIPAAIWARAWRPASNISVMP